MLKYYRDVLHMSIKLMDISGVSPEQLKIRRTLWPAVNLTIMIILLVMGFAFDKWTFKHTVDLLVTAFLISHNLVKQATAASKRESLHEFIADMNNFWPIVDPRFKRDAIFESSCFSILRYCNWVTKSLVIYIVVLFLLLPVFSILGAGLTYEVYKPKFAPYLLLVLFDFFTTTAIGPVLLGIDCIVATLAMLLWMQFRILNQRLRSIDYTNGRNHVRSCIVHHNFLLMQCKKFSEIFSTMFLCFIWNEAALLCVLLYVLSESADQQMILKAIAIICIEVLEVLVFYFLPLQFLTDEAAKVVEHVYFSPWYESSEFNIRKSLLVTMTKSQCDLVISAGKLMPMNLVTFKAIIKSSFSFYTFLHNLKAK